MRPLIEAKLDQLGQNLAAETSKKIRLEEELIYLADIMEFRDEQAELLRSKAKKCFQELDDRGTPAADQAHDSIVIPAEIDELRRYENDLVSALAAKDACLDQLA